MTRLEIKLRRAKSAIYRTRNYSSTLVPIHSLPQELLTHIFLLVSRSQHNCSDYGLDLGNRPEVISHVCSWWRELVLNLPSFWSVIRLAVIGDSAQLSRAITFAKRADPLSLDLQLHSQTSLAHFGSVADPSSFLATVSPRVRSLRLAIASANNFMSYSSTLSACLAHCNLGMLKTIITSYVSFGKNTRYYVFFDRATSIPAYLSDEHAYLVGDSIPNQNLAFITNLRLSGWYPSWTSTAYHGLIELQLLSTAAPNHVLISEHHLLGILGASPALRILEFDLEIVVSHLADEAIVPVQLECLESLKVGLVAGRKLGDLVRWLFPGSIPFQLSLSDTDDEDIPALSLPLLDHDVTSFFSRSNIKEVHAAFFNSWSLDKISNLCPHLHTLALESFNFSNNSEQTSHPILPPNLESLFLLDCLVVPQPTFINATHSPALKSLLLWNCSYFDDSGARKTYPNGLDNILVDNCPDARVVDYNPIQGWSFF
ncbi:hypothetical protein ACGC1H_003256 [Rhizoctonia solani]